ncbi:alpha,alpha-trehalase TreF [Halomicrobium urmianum]|uniref:alpha,alpha-trehalase TreF n=1 Tax=Halomicrobium urmianum TaxID=1586233 RepID=UPI001CDA0F19|nr:alpha,alpha-trehalase TreF [Halomicrobium urmianum]
MGPRECTGTSMDIDDPDAYPQLRGELFERVQCAHLFEDSKRFVDSVPTEDAEVIRRRFRERRDETDFDLRAFVDEHFEIVGDVNPDPADESGGRLSEDATPFGDRPESMEAHIDRLWPHLTRTLAEPDERDSLLSLPEPYVVPGGRFREMYYWDSYFTAEGLAACDRLERVADLVENMASLIDRFGFVPNGNRVYFASRSQLPLFAATVGILVRERGLDAARPYLDRIEREYAFWMDGAEDLSADEPGHRRAILPDEDDDRILNRYWDDNPSPREESWREDRAVARQAPSRDERRLYRDVRAACESGWDFSSRWLADPHRFETIRTTELVPIDLNAALFDVERKLARWLAATGEDDRAERFREAARRRRTAIDEYCWDPDAAFYFDYRWTDGERTDVRSLAAVAPLFFGCCSDAQAAAVADALAEQFLADGGLVTTLRETGEQWDSPNGWAPLHWFAVRGLRRYGHDDLADEIADRWLSLNRAVFDRSGKLVEKYNVVDTDLVGGGGEYPLQDGFGWTNAVAAALQRSDDRRGFAESPVGNA